jgi:GntR family transcriptional regulator
MGTKPAVYLRLNATLRRIVGGLDEGDRFLTEREVSRRFSVSRATANKSLSSLVAEGVLEFKKGVGTFVRGEGLDYDLRRLVSFTDQAYSAGKSPSTRVLARTLLAKDLVPREAAAVGPAVFMERLRLADRRPVIIERRWVSASLCPGLEREDLTGSLYALWTDRYRLSLMGADQSVRAVSLGVKDAQLLEDRPRAAALRVVCTGYVEGGRALWYERTLYRGDAYEFQSRMGGVVRV